MVTGSHIHEAILYFENKTHFNQSLIGHVIRSLTVALMDVHIYQSIFETQLVTFKIEYFSSEVLKYI